jgi:hypothetical protein
VIRQIGRYFFCTWVLWAEWGGGMVDGYMPYRFQPIEAFRGKVECDASRVRVQLAKGYLRALCLPDTVKPTGH